MWHAIKIAVVTFSVYMVLCDVTDRSGVPAVKRHEVEVGLSYYRHHHTMMPFLIRVDGYSPIVDPDGRVLEEGDCIVSIFYLWIGPVVRLAIVDWPSR